MKQQRQAAERLISNALLSDLKACSIRRDLQWGRRIHAKAVQARSDSHIYVVTALMKMYGKCRSMADAQGVFNSIHSPDVVCWNVLLLGYAENGQGLAALDLFSKMETCGSAPDPVTYVAVLKACTALAVDGAKVDCLRRGREIHSRAGCHLDQYVQNSLIDMYSKCGSMVDARCVFDVMHSPDVVSWNVLLLGYADNGEGLVALDLFSRMKASSCTPNSITYVAALKACTSLAVCQDGSRKGGFLERGREIHSEIGSHLNHYVENMLVDMYTKCGSTVEARCVFDSMHKPNVVSWNSLILGYVENGDGHEALQMFSKMKTMRECAPDSVTYMGALKACTLLAASGGLERGREIHSEIGRHLNQQVQNTLIDMYAKCGSMVEAHRVFAAVQKPDVVTWTALLSGYANNGEGNICLELFSKMKADGCAPDSVAYVAAFKACTSLAVNADSRRASLELGRAIHSDIGCHMDHYVQNTLVDMYAKCGSMVEARSVFDSIERPNQVSWNALLLGYAEHGEGLVVLDLYTSMKTSGCAPDSITYIAALKACASLAVNGDRSAKADNLERGRLLHSEIAHPHLDGYVKNTLIDMYSKCGSMAEAQTVFDSIQNPDVVSWSSLLLGYAENGEGHIVLDLFARLKASKVSFDSVTYVAAVKACTSLAATGDKRDSLERCRAMHSEIGWHADPHVQNTLIDMYCKCGSMADAHRLFDGIQNPDMVSWNVLLLGYADNGEGLASLGLYSRMKASGFAPGFATYIAALKACTSMAVNGCDKRECLQRGREIHAEIGSHLNPKLQNTLIDMYSKCGSMVDARTVFDSMQTPDVVSWNALILGYVENGKEHVSVELFSRMKASGCTPSTVTYIAALRACTLSGSLALGQKVHSEIREFTSQVVTCLVDLYAKCGSVLKAREVFDSHSGTRELPSWNALLAGYATSDSAAVFNLFEAMKDEGVQPDVVTFMSVLLCCSHAGLVEKAKEYFEAMASSKYRVVPTLNHYNCLLDALGRANQLNEAIALVRKMPVCPDAVTWRVLLAACRKWKNVGLGRLVSRSLMEMDKEDSSAYVLMGHIYGSRGMFGEQASLLQGLRLESRENGRSGCERALLNPNMID